MQRLPEKEFFEIYGKVPRLCIELIITSDQGILLSKRDIEPGKGFWHLPGGTVLFGGNLKENAARIAEEETGLTLSLEKLLGTIEYSSKNSVGQSISLVYHAKPIGGTVRGSHQAREVSYFKTLPEPIISETKDFLLQNNLIKL